MKTKRLNKNDILAVDAKVLSAVDQHFAKLKSLSVAGTSHTPRSLKAVFQAEIDATQAIDKARAQMQEQMTETRTVRATAQTTRKGLKAFILGTYGAAAAQILSDFGFGPKAPGAQTVEAKAQAAAKAKATRKARNTMGKRQREKVTGGTVNVSADAMPTVTASAALPVAATSLAVDAKASPVSPANGSS